MRAEGTISGSRDEINGWVISKDRRSATWGDDTMEIVPELMPARLGANHSRRGRQASRRDTGSSTSPSTSITS